MSRKRLMCSVGGKPTEASQNPVAWMEGRRETESLKSMGKASSGW
jgi:hypothetical protein